MRRYSIPLLLAQCSLLALGCSQEIEQNREVTDEHVAALFAADPPISDEIEITAPNLEPRTSVDPRIAFGDGTYLVVWSIPTIYPSAHMYGTRVLQSGEVVDKSGFYIGPGYPQDITFGNGEFVVVSTPVMSNPNGEIRATRISSAGQVLDPGGVVIAPDDVNSTVDVFPTIASDGKDFLIAWTENGNLPTIFRSLRLARFTGAGEVLDPGGKLFTELLPWTNTPSLYFDGQQYLLSWTPSFDYIYGTRLSKNAEPLDPNPFVIDDFIGNHTQLKTLHDGTNFIVMSGIDNGASKTMRVRKVDSTGKVDPNALAISTGINTASFSDAAFHGQRILVTLDDYTFKRTHSFHMTTDGIISDPVPPLLAEDSRDARLAATATGGSLVVWAEKASYGSPAQGITMATRIDLAGKKLDSPAIAISTRASKQEPPRVTFGGKDHFLAWREGSEFLSARVTPLGDVVEGPGLPFKDPTNGLIQIAQVVSAGESSLPIWVQTTQSGNLNAAYATRLSSEGSVLDPVPVQLPDSNFGPYASHHYLAAADAEGALFVGAYSDTSIPFAIRIKNDGTVQPLVQIGAQPCVPKSLTFDGTDYLLTCSTPIGDYPSVDFDATLLGAKISTSGQMIDEKWKPLFTFPNTLFEWFNASFDGKNHWFIWRTDEYDVGYWPNFPRTVRLHAFGVSAAGDPVISEPLLLSELNGCGSAAVRSLHPAVGSVNGTTYVVWSETPNGGSCDVFPIDLMGVTIDSLGAVSPKFTVSSMPGDENAPAISVHPDGQILVTYARFSPESPYAAERARARFITTCVCPDGQSCVVGMCSSSSSGGSSGSTTGGANPPGDGPIRFGGCGCRIADDASAKSSLGLALAMLGLAGWRRRRQRAS